MKIINTTINNKTNTNFLSFSSGYSFSSFSPNATNSTTVKDLRQSIVPGINVVRNSTRLARSIALLTAYIEIQLRDLDDTSRMVLKQFMTELESMYHTNSSNFVAASKQLGNWLKVNLFKKVRLQGDVKDVHWNAHVSCPNQLVGVIAEFHRIEKGTLKTQYLRALLSILNLYESITIPTNPSLDTITKPSNVDQTQISSQEILTALETLGIDVAAVTNDFKFMNQSPTSHSSSSAGPNGQAVWYSHLDAKALWQDETLKMRFNSLATILEREDLKTLLKESAGLPKLQKANRNKPNQPKQHKIYEKGNKTRVIAILDYFTQEILTPFHDLVASILKKIEMDGTFDQDKIARWVKSKTAQSCVSLYSYDLTAATDRLPVWLQRRIIECLIKIDNFGLNWQLLLTDRAFDNPIGEPVKYCVGQPMGAKSSFPMLGLTHHIIVQIAAKRTGFQGLFTEYVILGDDICIADDLVAAKYKEMMIELGLTISEHKTIVSTVETSIDPVAEICKRVFIGGVEVTPLPMKLAANVTENNDLFFQFREKLSERGLIYNPADWKYFVAACVSNHRSLEKIGLYNSMPLWLSGFKQSLPIGTVGNNNFEDWLKAGMTEDYLREVWTFTVLQEQFKRISTLIQSAQDTFQTISKGIRLGDAVYIVPDTGIELPVTKFDIQKMNEWNILNIPHPARFVMLGEVNRVATLFSQLSSIRGPSLMTKLTHNIVDNLKFSVLEMINDMDNYKARVDRQLLEKMISNIRMIIRAENKTVTYTVKLTPLGIVWVLRLSHLGSCTLFRSTSAIPTTLRDAELKFKRMNSGNSQIASIFDT
ncbi:putative RNA-dependent RNA polymerase [Rhizoctonia oryzae-sativae mitovirus 1]|uniref:RNA-dependent RNA polymerase n=1 Tax=Rhizoctonia oryzae-sativae mitovirus 1 TaxID=1837089 RepID=A0A166H5D4_9VIRU|nr:putative RNA-dependent RNA polymerase [Rhizoctonia oryzae-sativae mitovirus 1]ANA08076.1 putative RNA-dependent RNA polymerase [Rhizoctonia oryzae-sativae mitovirus 1]